MVDEDWEDLSGTGDYDRLDRQERLTEQPPAASGASVDTAGREAAEADLLEQTRAVPEDGDSSHRPETD